MERVVRGRSSTLYKTFFVDGVATDPTGTPTVTVTRLSDGSTVTTGAVTNEAAAGTWSVTIPATSNLLLDTLTVDWAATVNGVSQEFLDTVEVAGDVIFSLADARNVPGLAAKFNDDSYKISSAQILAARTEVERALEHELQFAMVPRYTLETVRGDGTRTVLLKWPHLRAIRSVSVNGVALGVSDVALISASVSGSLYYPNGWTVGGYDNITVGYEYGLGVPPPRAKDVALALTKRALTGAPADDRAQTMSTDEQTTTFYVPGAGEPFDVPAANRFVQSHTLRVGLA
jgi:hypothetical protein